MAPRPPAHGTKLGIALQTQGRLPLNAVRHAEEQGTCGWYIWWGDELADDNDFFKPLHVEHIVDRCPELLPYLALPPGWRVQLAPGHEDAWLDAAIPGTGIRRHLRAPFEPGSADLVFLEIETDDRVTRQIQVIDDRWLTSLDPPTSDGYGGLPTEPLERLDLSPYTRISADEFDTAWKEALRRRTR